MKYFLSVLSLIVFTTFAYGQTSTYQFKKVTYKSHAYVYLISGTDTVKFTKAAVMHKGSDQHATINGDRYEFLHEKDRPWKFMTADTLLGSSRNRNFFNVKAVNGAAYDFSDTQSENNLWRYTVDGKEVMTARYYKSGKGKFIEINVVNGEIENFEFIKMMTLLYGVSDHYGSSNAKTWLIISVAALCIRMATI